MKDVFAENNGDNENDITVTVKKVGGKPESTSKTTWKDSLKESNSCRVINRNANPKPIWELLRENHKDDFERPLLLANAMQEEWETYTQPEVQARYKGADRLRRKRNMWLEKVKDKDQRFSVLYSNLKELANMRQILNVSDEDWREQVLYSSDVQNILIWAAGCRKDTSDLLEKQQLTTAIHDILNPISEIESRYFRNLKDILDSIDDSEKLPERLEITQLTDLPHVLSECWQKSEEGVSVEAKCKYIQRRLELTVKDWSEKNESSYEYILCRIVLHLNGFDTKSFRFEFLLGKQDIYYLIESLREHFSHFESIIEKSKKHAYLLYLSLESKQHAAWEETFDAIPDISPQIIAIVEGARRGEPNIDLNKLKRDLKYFLQGKTFSFDLKSLTEFIKSQFNGICRVKHADEMRESSPQETKPELDTSVDRLLIALGMKKFYPQKLTYEKVIMLTSNSNNESMKQPMSLHDLPWFFLRRIVALDSSARENCNVLTQQEYGDESSSDSSDSDVDLDDESEDDSSDSDVKNQTSTKLRIAKGIYITKTKLP